MDYLTQPAYMISPDIDFGGTPEIIIPAAPSFGETAVSDSRGFFGNIGSTLGGAFNSILNSATQVGSTAASIIGQGWLQDLAQRNGVATTLDSSPISTTNATNPVQEKQTAGIAGLSNDTIKKVAIGGAGILLLILIVKKGKK